MQGCADFRMGRHRGRKDSAHADISQTQAKDAFLRGQPNNSAMITKGECYREIRSGSRCLGIESTMSKAEVTLLQGKAIDSKDGVTLGGSSVGANGAFAPRPQPPSPFDAAKAP